MVTKREFNRIREENPESIIGQRTRNYQNAWNKLALVLSKGDEKNEKSARMNYLVEKTFSKEKLEREDYDFILGLSTQDLESFHSKIVDRVLDYKRMIIRVGERGDDAPFDSDTDGLVAGNKILRFISQTRNDVFSEPFWINGAHTHVYFDGKMWYDDMKLIYPNRDEMVAENEADTKAKKEELKQSRKDNLKDENRKDVFEKIYGDKEAVVKDLKENFVNIEEDVMFGQKGKKLKLELPEVGDFKGFKFELFISDETVNAKDLKKTPNLENQLYSMKEIGDLLLAIRKYMEQYDVELDGHYYYNYESMLKEDHYSDAGDCLNKILDLNGDYWLKNKLFAGQEYSHDVVLKPHFVLRCPEGRCFFENSKDPLDLRDIFESRIMGSTGSNGGIDDAKIITKLS